MNENKPVVVNGGSVGFCGLLTLVFIVLKLCKVISWSWLWVLAPLWVPVGIALVICIIAALIAIVVDTFC